MSERTVPAWRLEGYDTFDGQSYPLGTIRLEGSTESIDGMKPSYDSYEDALADARKRLAGLETSQPAARSGGQGTYGIQDRVFIIHPDGRRERVSS